VIAGSEVLELGELKIGVIGCGSITEWAHLPVLTGPDIVIPTEGEDLPYRTLETEKPKVLPRVVALCDLNLNRLNKLGDRYNISRRFTDYRRMLNEVKLDALVVAAGHKFNVEIIPQAIERRLHIFVEKPMTSTLREALEIRRIVEGSGIVFQVGFMRRFYYAYRNAKRLIFNGEIGEIQALSGRFWSGRKDDLLNNGIHIFDIIQFLAGPVIEVYAKSHGDNIALIMEFENGAVGNLLLAHTGITISVHERIEIVGSEGKTLVAENGRRLYLSRGGRQPLQSWEPSHIAHTITGYNIAGFAGELRHFVNCISSNTQPIAGVESGVYSIRLKEGIEKSLDEGKAIKLSDLEL